MNYFVIAFWVLMPTLIIGGLIWAAHVERKRKESLQQLAQELGMSFADVLSDHDQGVLIGFALGQRGHSRKHFNAMTADSGELRMVVFDYAYTIGGGKNKQRHTQSVVLLTCPSLYLPAFSLAPETFLDRMAEMLGYKDIDFDDDEEFSRRYLLKGPDEAAIRDYFTRERRQAFLKWPKLTIEAAGHSFIFYEARKRRPPEEAKQLMEQGFAVYSMLEQGSRL